MDNIFPICFVIAKTQGDVTNDIKNDVLEFTEEYRFIFSMSILKKYLTVALDNIETWKHLIPKILVSLNICEKKLLTIDDQID